MNFIWKIQQIPCPLWQRKDLQNLIWLPHNLNYDVTEKIYFINFSHCRCLPCILQCFIKIIHFSRVIMKLFLFSERIISFGKLFSSFYFSFFPLVIMKLLLEDINMVTVWEMAETSLVPNLSIKKELRITNYSQSKSLLKLISSFSYCLENFRSTHPIFLPFFYSVMEISCWMYMDDFIYCWFRVRISYT